MSEFAASAYRALMLPDWRWTSANLWAAHSTYTQSTPLPGVPIPAQSTSLTLRTSGVQAAGTEIDVVALNGGMPGRTRSAGLVWRYDGDVAYRGWEPPHILAGWDCPSWTTQSNVNERPDAATLPDGTVIIASAGVTGGTTRLVRVRIRSTAGAWSTVTVYAETYISGLTSCPALCALPNGRVLLFAFAFDSDDNTMTVYTHYSDDSGATWTLGSRDALPVPIGTTNITPGRLRAAYKDGQVLLIAWLADSTRTYPDYLVQYASSDLGATFLLVESQSDASGSSEGYPDVLVADGAFVVSYVRKADNLPVSIRLGAAAHPISGGVEVAWGATAVATQSSNAFTAGDLAVAADDRGTLWGYVRSYSSSGEIGLVYVSHDGGLTWGPGNGLTSGFSWWWDSNDADGFPRNYAATYQRGRVVLAHNWFSTNGNEDSSLGVAYLGGSTVTTMPRHFAGALVGWTETWLPFELPRHLTWTATGTATLEDLVTPGALQLQTSSNPYYYTQTLTTTIVQGIGAEFVFSRAAGVASVLIRLADGTNDYEVEVFKDGGGDITIRDNNAGPATLAAVTAADATAHAVRIFVANGSVSAWTRASDTNEDREWVLAVDGDSLTSDTGAPAATSIVRWGTDASSSTHDVKFYRMSLVWGSQTKRLRDVAAGQTNPDDLHPMPVGPLPTHLADGLFVSAVNGPAMAGHAWTIPVRYGYPIENLFAPESPSSTQQWRATDETDAIVAVQLDTIADADFPNDIIGVYVDQPQAGSLTLEIRTSGSWVTVGSAVDLAITGLTFTRDGSSVEITSGGEYRAIEPGELVGQDFYLSSSVARRIAWNDGGTITTSVGSANKRVRLYLEGADGADPSSGAGGRLVWPRSLAVFQLAGAKATGVRVTLTADPVAGEAPSQGFLSCGAMLVGPIYPLARSYEASRSTTHRVLTDVFAAPDGTAQAAVKGPVLREWALNWDMDDERPLDLGLDDYVLASDVSNAEPVGQRSDVARVAAGMIRQLDGPGSVFVYVPYLPHLTAAATILKLPRAFAPALARTMGDLQVNTILGDEGEGEVLRFGMTFREEG